MSLYESVDCWNIIPKQPSSNSKKQLLLHILRNFIFLLDKVPRICCETMSNQVFDIKTAFGESTAVIFRN